MGDYLKLFETHAEYQAYSGGGEMILPNVSYCEDNNEVYYNPIVPPSRVITAVFNIPTTANPISLTYENGWNDIESVLVTSPNGSTFELSYSDLVEYDSMQGLDPFMGYQFDATGNYTFEYTLKPNVTEFSSDLFAAVIYLTSVTIPNSITSIGDNSFIYCDGLTSVTIPNSVTSIGTNVFYGCSNLVSVTIPNSVISIGNTAFQGCYFTSSNFINNSSLDEVTNNYWGATIVDSDTNGFCIQNNSLVKYRGTATDVTIPTGVTSIGISAFRKYISLTSVTIPTGVTSISNVAFQYCSSLTSVSIPNSVISIGDGAFGSCTSLISATIGNSVTSIDNSAFAGCSSLTSITVEATTPPTLGGNNVFGKTNNYPIYVPSASVEAYKAASYWSDYASRIQAIHTT